MADIQDPHVVVSPGETCASAHRRSAISADEGTFGHSSAGQGELLASSVCLRSSCPGCATRLDCWWGVLFLGCASQMAVATLLGE